MSAMHPHYPFEDQPKKKKRSRIKKALLWLGGILLVLFLIGSCIETDDEVEPPAEPTATAVASPEPTETTQDTETPEEASQSPEPTTEAAPEPVEEETTEPETVEESPEPVEAVEEAPEPEPVTLEDALASVAPDATLDATLADEMGTMVRFDISDNFTTGMMRSVAHADILDIVEALANADEDYGVGIQVTGNVDLIDNLGNEVSRMGIHTEWKRETVENINWENKYSLDVELAADTYSRHPALN